MTKDPRAKRAAKEYRAIIEGFEKLTPERVEAPSYYENDEADAWEAGYDEAQERAAATITELRAEVERWKGQEQATSELCRERGEALAQRDAALREIASLDAGALRNAGISVGDKAIAIARRAITDTTGGDDGR